MAHRGRADTRKYRKTPKHSDTGNIAVIILKFEQQDFTLE